MLRGRWFAQTINQPIEQRRIDGTQVAHGCLDLGIVVVLKIERETPDGRHEVKGWA